VRLQANHVSAVEGHVSDGPRLLVPLHNRRLEHKAIGAARITIDHLVVVGPDVPWQREAAVDVLEAQVEGDLTRQLLRGGGKRGCAQLAPLRRRQCVLKEEVGLRARTSRERGRAQREGVQRWARVSQGKHNQARLGLTHTTPATPAQERLPSYLRTCPRLGMMRRSLVVSSVGR
jgi:hypothetical protein